MAPHVCPWWVGYILINPLRKLRENPRKILGPYVKQGMTVMDIGCGMGFFTLEMARLVGPNGLVIGVDLQERMLDALKKRAARFGLAGRIRTHRCDSVSLGEHPPIDFVLACYVAHEVLDRGSFFSQIRSFLKPGGKLLLAEPKLHVSKSEFEAIVADAVASGLVHVGESAVRIGRNAEFQKQ
ncbi:MAG: methyltransferase domain-containing protein [Thermodesulfobacteriota bacterium]